MKCILTCKFQIRCPFSSQQPETLDNPKNQGIFRIIQGFRIKLTKKQAFAVQLLINSNVLLPPAAKMVELIIFSGPKQSFGPAIADCRQCGTK